MERNYEKEQLERERLAPVAYELEKEKHILRQMQGRRLEELNPGEYHATRNPQHPVMLEGHWQDPPLDELLKHDTVHQLQVGVVVAVVVVVVVAVAVVVVVDVVVDVVMAVAVAVAVVVAVAVGVGARLCAHV